MNQSYAARDAERSASGLLYCDHVEGDGENLFQLVCDSDLEGIVAKRKFDPYIEKQASWLKIRNTSYSQWEGREELFERERASDPDVSLWDDCVRARGDVAVWFARHGVAMRRERTPKVVLVLLGLLFSAAVYPLMMMVKQDPALATMMSHFGQRIHVESIRTISAGEIEAARRANCVEGGEDFRSVDFVALHRVRFCSRDGEISIIAWRT